MSENRILRDSRSQRLYESYAKSLPIIDYHNHICINDLVCDRTYDTITQLWIQVDPYKHRAMRILGVPERLITGEATDYEKFEAWYQCLPRLAGNPLYDWSCMEFSKLFHIQLEPFTAPAAQVYRWANDRLKTLSANKILSLFNIEYNAPCAALTDNVSIFSSLQGVCPSLRADTVVAVELPLIEALSQCARRPIRSLKDFEAAVADRMEAFYAAGCRFSDHALDNGFTYIPDDGNNPLRFERLLSGQESQADRLHLSSYILKFMGQLYAGYGMVMQLHIGAQRTTSSRLRAIAGAAGGYAAIGNSVDVASLTALLDDIEGCGRLPKTILFNLNPADNGLMSVLSGAYSAEGVESVVTQGPAWWWCDHAHGMRQMLDNMSVYSVLSTFIGMTTDSRSLLSFVRHDYFRQLLCQWLSEKVEQGVLPDDEAILADIIQRACYKNAKKQLEV